VGGKIPAEVPEGDTRPFLRVKREKRTYRESKPVGKQIPVLFRKLRTLLNNVRVRVFPNADPEDPEIAG